MKKLIIIPCVILSIFATGCSVDIDGITSEAKKFETKTEEFADLADHLGTTVEDTYNKLEKLEHKVKLNSQDQEQIVKQIDKLLDVIKEFKSGKPPIFKWAMELSEEKLKEKEEPLLTLREKANNNDATKADIKEVKEELKKDIEIKLFEK